MADEESDSDYDLRARISALANNLGTSSTDPKFSLMVEHVHENVSALKRPRKANILMAMARRPELEKQGLSPGEIGALRRTGAVVSRANEFVFRSISVDSAYMPVLSMSSGVVDVNYGERELKFLPEGYAPVANWRTKLLHAARRTSREEPDGVYTLLDREKELTETLSNPDPSGALYVLSLLDKLDEAARGRGEAAAPDHPESSTSGWRRASVEDYGRAMRLALEELAESDRREIERARLEHETVMVEIERCREEFEEFAGCSLLDLVTGRPP